MPWCSCSSTPHCTSFVIWKLVWCFDHCCVQLQHRIWMRKIQHYWVCGRLGLLQFFKPKLQLFHQNRMQSTLMQSC